MTRAAWLTALTVGAMLTITAAFLLPWWGAYILVALGAVAVVACVIVLVGMVRANDGDR